jgi:hypothetical protein
VIVDIERPIATALVDLSACFFCGHKCDLPVIEWKGSTGAIVLHPRCAHRLTLRLSRDMLELEHLAGLLEIAA